MREYKETAITGHQYTRCKSVQIINDLGAPNRAILFGEETVAVLGDTHITASKGSAINVLTPDNGATEFEIIDFETMQPTGRKMTYAEVYTVMAGLYLHTAMKRDADEEDMIRQAEENRIAEEQRQAEEAERQRQADEAERQRQEAETAELARQAEENQRQLRAAEEQARAEVAAEEQARAEAAAQAGQSAPEDGQPAP